MALSLAPTAHLLSIGSSIRSGLFRRDDELLDGYLVHRNARLRFRVLETGRNANIRVQAISDINAGVDFRTIAQVNEAIRNAESVQAAVKILEDTKVAGVHTPNEASYASLMLACRKHKQGERALTVYEVMKQAKIPISLRTYNSLMSCCQQALRLEDAFRVKTELEAAGLKPDVVTYTSLLDTVVRSARTSPTLRLQKALELHKEMEGLEITADLKTYNCLIQAAGEAKSTEKALEFYQQLTKAGLSANSFTFDLLLKCLGSGGRFKAALQVYNEARAAGVKLFTSTYNFLIEACATAPQPSAQKAWAFYEEMKSNNLRVTAQTYINLISACSKAGDNSGVMKAFQLMKEGSFTRSITTTAYNQIIDSASLANTLDDALQIYYEMKNAGYRPNALTYSSLISACIRHADFQKAEKLEEEEFKDVDVSSNQAVLHSLIRAYGDAGKYEESLRIFRDMLKKGMAPTEESFASVFDACLPKERVSALFSAENKKFDITDDVQVGIQFYQEYLAKGQLTNFTATNLSRCDLKTMGVSGVVFTVLAWLTAVRSDPPSSDLILVTGNVKEVDNAPGKPRYPKRHTIAMKIVRALGLPIMRLNTLAMLALTISNESVKKWINGPNPFQKKTEGSDDSAANNISATDSAIASETSVDEVSEDLVENPTAVVNETGDQTEVSEVSQISAEEENVTQVEEEVVSTDDGAVLA